MLRLPSGCTDRGRTLEIGGESLRLAKSPGRGSPSRVIHEAQGAYSISGESHGWLAHRARVRRVMGRGEDCTSPLSNMTGKPPVECERDG